MNKKAQGMSMNIIIIAALAVMVLLLVGSFMTGGFRALTGKITSFVASGPSAETTGAQVACDQACLTWKNSGCTNFNAVKSSCAGGALAAWGTAYTDPTDGNTYTSTCSAVVGGVTTTDASCGSPGTVPTFTKAGDYATFTVSGAGGRCSCTVKYGETSGWGN